jgi:hypothetical protein
VRNGRSGRDDPAPPDRTRFTPPFDAAVAVAAERALRLAAYQGSDRARRRPGKHRRRLPAYSPAVRHAVYEAIHDAGRAGVRQAGPRHLLVAVLRLPDGAAERFVEDWPGSNLTRVLVALRGSDSYRREMAPHELRVGMLKFWRVLPATAPRGLELPWRALVRLLDWVLLRHPYRRHGARYGHLLPWDVHASTAELGVRLGRPVVTSAEVLLTILDVHEELDRAGVELPAEVARYNRAGEVLREHGVTLSAAIAAAAGLPMLAGDAEDDLAGIDFRGWSRPRPRPGGPSYGRTALTVLHAASAAARHAGHPYAGTGHQLAAALADLDGPAARLLARLGAPVERIRADALS